MLLLSLLLVSSNYFVAPNGNDTNTGNICCPLRTIASGLSRLNGGDILNIRAGDYFENIPNTIPSGSSWDSATTVQAYNGEKVVLNGSTTDYQDLVSIIGTNKHFIILSGLILDGSHLTNGGNVIKGTYPGGGGSAHHVRLTNCVIRNAHKGNGVLLTAGAASVPTYWEFLNCSIYSNGLFSTSAAHGAYITTSSNLFDGGTNYGNRNLGFQFYSGAPSGNIVRNYVFPGGGVAASAGETTAAIGVYGGTNNLFENNLFYGCGYAFVNYSYASATATISRSTFQSNYVAIQINSGGLTVENNFISDATASGYQQIHAESGVSSNSPLIIRGNILEGSGLNGRVLDRGGRGTISNNLTNQVWTGSNQRQRYLAPAQ